MPKLDVSKVNYKITFDASDENGKDKLYAMARRLRIAAPVPPKYKEQKPGKKYVPPFYTLPATLEVAIELKKVFANNFKPTDKYINFVKEKYNAELEFRKLHARVKEIKNFDPKLLDLGWEFKNPPRDHQRTGFKLITELGSILLAWDMRTGKTFTVANSMEFLLASGRIKKVVVICPKDIMTTCWISDVYKHTNLQGLALNDSSTKKRIATAKRRVITVEKGQGRYKNIRGDASYWVFNHDTCRMVKEGTKYVPCNVLKYILEEIQPDMVVFDESHAFKSMSAQRTKGALKLCESVHEQNGIVALMSGTPIPKDQRDYYSQMTMVDPTAFDMSLPQFTDRYCNYIGGFDMSSKKAAQIKVIGIKNEDELNRRSYARKHRMLIEDCHDMPDKIYSEFPVELGKEGRTHHTRLYNDLITYVEGEPVKTTSLSKVIKCHQCTGGYIYVDGKVVYLKEQPKIAGLQEILDQVLSVASRKAVVWTNYIPPIFLIRNLLRKMKIKFTELTSQSAEADRAEWIFNNDKDCKIMLATPRKSPGKDMGVASYSIYYDNTYEFVWRGQSEARTYTPESIRFGKINIIDIMAQGTIDKTILLAARSKEKLNNLITSESLRKYR